MVSLTAVPLAVIPGAHHQVDIVPVIVLGHGPVGGQRAVEVFGIVPATDNQYLRFDVVKVLQDIARFPVVIVIRVLGQFVPERPGALEVFFIDVAERAQFAEELVAVRCSRLHALWPGRHRAAALLVEGVEKQKRHRYHKRAVAVEVVKEPVGDRRLR